MIDNAKTNTFKRVDLNNTVREHTSNGRKEAIVCFRILDGELFYTIDRWENGEWIVGESGTITDSLGKYFYLKLADKDWETLINLFKFKYNLYHHGISIKYDANVLKQVEFVSGISIERLKEKFA